MTVFSPGKYIANRYEVLSQPLMGGMGIVYFCLDQETHLPVAIKAIKPEYLLDRKARARYIDEATTWLRLGNHPNIVRCYEVVHDEPVFFLVLEWIQKEPNFADSSLRSRLIPGRPLSQEQALLFALHIVRGMGYATKIIPGLVHRDIKPENLLIGADLIPGKMVNILKLTDFGLCKIVQNNLDFTSWEAPDGPLPSHMEITLGAGTPLYMAPEQWLGR
jgi:serine/threonine protein kinase